MKRKKGKQTHVKQALAHTLLSIFPQVMSIAFLSLPFPTLGPCLGQILFMRIVLNLRPSKYQTQFPRYCSSVPLSTRGLNLTLFLHLLHFPNHNFSPDLSLSPWDLWPGVSSFLFLPQEKLLDIFSCPLLLIASSLILVPAHLSSQPHSPFSFLPHHSFFFHQYQQSSVVFFFFLAVLLSFLTQPIPVPSHQPSWQVSYKGLKVVGFDNPDMVIIKIQIRLFLPLTVWVMTLAMGTMTMHLKTCSTLKLCTAWRSCHTGKTSANQDNSYTVSRFLLQTRLLTLLWRSHLRWW